MKSTHYVQQRSQNQDERLCSFGDPAFCRIAQENRNSNPRASIVTIWDLGRCAVSVAVPNVFVLRVRD